ncbi:hypothetical protein GCM10017673_54540 [Streptosporangium violaceochromogenes]|nr:hypothetical protein GCM10017673_54540 [Streptosporangium violaceochromogenes]
MSNPSAPVLDRVTPIRGGCGCFADAVPMPMGCALCGHAPYAHGCPASPADHDYVQPSGELMGARLEARRCGGPVRLPRFGPPIGVAPGETVPLVPAQRRPEPASAPEVPEAPPAAPATRPARPSPPWRMPRSCPRSGGAPAATGPARRGDSRRPAPGTRPGTRPGARVPGTAGAAPPSRRLSSHPIKRTRPALATPGRVHNRTTEVRSAMNANSPTPAGAGTPVRAGTLAGGVIPGWRIIVSDAGRLWASRETPFPRETDRCAPPYRTVDGDTLDELRTEVERQEQAARELKATPGKATAQAQAGAGQPADRTGTSGGGKTTPEAVSRRVGT